MQFSTTLIRFKIFFPFILVLGFAHRISFAMEVTSVDRIVERTISSITEVADYIPTKKKGVVFAFDWDETVILEDGNDDSGLREGDATAGIFAQLAALHLDYFILTSRYGGSSLAEIDQKYIKKKTNDPLPNHVVAREMYKTSAAMLAPYKLFPEGHMTFPFKEDPGLSYCFEMTDLGFKKDKALLTPHMVFAGSRVETASNKGRVMASILDLHAAALAEGKGDSMFASRQEITHVVFIDNDPDHIEAMREAFANRKERLTLLYYPKVENMK